MMVVVPFPGREPRRPPATLPELKRAIRGGIFPGLEEALELADEALERGHGERDALLFLLATLRPPAGVPQDSA